MKRIFLILLCVMLICSAMETASAAEPAAIDPDKPMVALTYDDGPYSPVTNRILDALEAVGGRATFFVVGNRVAGCASVLRRAERMGCQIGNHTWDHTDLTTLNTAAITEQLKRCDDAVETVIGKRPTLLRPVGGCVNSRVCDAVDRPMVLWSIDTRDWCSNDGAKTVRCVLSQVKDGDVILLHDLFVSTADASEELIPRLVEQGFQLVTVEELARYRGYSLAAHTTYTRFE